MEINYKYQKHMTPKIGAEADDNVKAECHEGVFYEYSATEILAGTEKL
jgi:hypothetical protein